MKNHTRLTAALLAGGSVLAMASAADAQAARAAPGGTVSEIVVTGSRVIQNGNNSPMPVTVATTEQMAAVQPTTLSDQINLLPQIQGSQGQSTSGTGIRNGSAAYVTLRNAGDNHTLVLWDGRRVPPATSQESHASDVDVNLIPQMFIQRVDVVTGGVSAVYGSDAVTGVVNFVTDNNFNGLKVNGSSGISDYSDNRQYNFGIGVGTKLFGDRGHFEASYEHRDDPGIFNRLSREIYANPQGFVGNGTTIPFTRATNVRNSGQSFVGLITNGPLSGLQFAQNGLATPFVHGTATGVTNQEIGGDGTYNTISSLKSSLKFNQLFGRFDYDLTDSIHAFMEVAGTQSKQTNIGTATTINLNIGYNNPYLLTLQSTVRSLLTPAQQTSLGTPTGAGSFAFTKTLLEIPQVIKSKTDFYEIITGINGAIGDYKWEASYVHADSNVYVRNTGNVNLGNYLAAANAVVNPANGQIVCNAALTNPTAYSSCVPINLFGPTSMTAPAKQYVTAQTGSDAQTEFNDVAGSVTGAPFSTWAGPVNMALSAEWRRLEYHLLSYSRPEDRVDCRGIQFSCTQGTTAQWQNNTLSNRPLVSQTVKEVAYEFDAPLLKDMPFVESLNLNGAARYTHYDSSGGVWTWKVGGDWHLNEQMTVRATRSRDIRAPNLNDLYNPPQPNIGNRQDLHTNTTAQTAAIARSNPNLVPEQADTYTLGGVWRPSFIPRFSLSLDGYSIKINDAILVISGTATQVQQACEASNGTSPLCDLFVRPLPFSNRTAANFPTAMLGQPTNIASIKTYGVDLEANYAADLLDRPLTLRALVAYQPHLVYDSGPSGVADIAGTAGGQIGYGNSSASPRVKGSFIAKYDVTPALSVTVLERWRSSMRPNANSTLAYVQNKVPSIAYTNLNLAYKLEREVGGTELFLNVQNLFNKFPKVGGVNTGDDPYGRYFTVGFRFRR